MATELDLIVIQTDELGASELEKAARSQSSIRFQKGRIQAQVGDPDIWTFVAELAKLAWPVIAPTIVLLIKQRKIKYIKIGNKEFHDITAKQFDRVVKALKLSTGQDRTKRA